MVVLEKTGKYELRGGLWHCLCDCGSIVTVLGESLESGCIKSCKRVRHSKTLPRDGRSKSRLYRIWIYMRRRCTRPSISCYEGYGGRGVYICEEWYNDFSVFQAWALANGYKDNLSIDRIDVNGGYTPENCRWADAKTQASNRRSNRKITFQGETLTLTQWAERFGMSRQGLSDRLSRGWPVERALTEPRHRKK